MQAHVSLCVTTGADGFRVLPWAKDSGLCLCKRQRLYPDSFPMRTLWVFVLVFCHFTDKDWVSRRQRILPIVSRNLTPILPASGFMPVSPASPHVCYLALVTPVAPGKTQGAERCDATRRPSLESSQLSTLQTPRPSDTGPPPHHRLHAAVFKILECFIYSRLLPLGPSALVLKATWSFSSWSPFIWPLPLITADRQADFLPLLFFAPRFHWEERYTWVWGVVAQI